MTGFRKAYQANCWGALGGEGVGVTSIARLNYRTFADMEVAIGEIAAAGYDGVELFDGNLLDYAGRVPDFTRILKAAGIRLVAAYSGGNFIFDDVLEEELARIREVADCAAEAGAEHLVVGGGAKRASGVRPDDYKKLGAALDKVAEIAERRGLRGHYHPHLTTIVESPDEVRTIFRNTRIDFCPDTAHLAAAGGDPAAMIREHRDRITYVHLKGFQSKPFAFTPLDAGDLDMNGVMRALTDTGYSGWITVELDSWPSPQEGAARSMEFLKRAEARAA